MKDATKNKIELCFTTANYHRFHNKEANVVIVDILRATSSICTAFMNGVKTIIPVSTVEEARSLKASGCMVAAERDGLVLDFADFGNSPFNFSAERVKNNTIAYSTTNGTKAINQALGSKNILIGSYLNISEIAKFLANDKSDVVIFCAGWKERFSLEDSIFGGALAQMLIDSGAFYTKCDSTIAMIDLWDIAKNDLIAYIQKAAQKNRLAKNGLDDCIEYCHSFDLTKIIPFFNGKNLESINNCEFSNKKNT